MSSSVTTFSSQIAEDESCTLLLQYALPEELRSRLIDLDHALLEHL